MHAALVTDSNEETNIQWCVRENKLSLLKVNVTSGQWGNPYLYIRVVQPLSITNQRYFVRRNLWNRLTPDDFRNILAAERKFYRDIHTMQRPPGAPHYAPVDNALLVESKPMSWEGFHQKHPRFLDARSYPRCAGFAGAVGVTFLAVAGRTIDVAAQNVVECCKKCAERFNTTAAIAVGEDTDDLPSGGADDVLNGYCGAWTFDQQTSVCTLGWGHQVYSATTWQTRESGMRVGPVCKRCGAGFDRLGWPEP